MQQKHLHPVAGSDEVDDGQNKRHRIVSKHFDSFEAFKAEKHPVQVNGICQSLEDSLTSFVVL